MPSCTVRPVPSSTGAVRLVLDRVKRTCPRSATKWRSHALSEDWLIGCSQQHRTTCRRSRAIPSTSTLWRRDARNAQVITREVDRPDHRCSSAGCGTRKRVVQTGQRADVDREGGQFRPYDFRRPTFARVLERLWAPDDPHVMTPQVFGVGWTVNFGRVMSLLRTRGGTAGPAATA